MEPVNERSNHDLSIVSVTSGKSLDEKLFNEQAERARLDRFIEDQDSQLQLQCSESALLHYSEGLMNQLLSSTSIDQTYAIAGELNELSSSIQSPVIRRAVEERAAVYIEQSIEHVDEMSDADVRDRHKPFKDMFDHFKSADKVAGKAMDLNETVESLQKVRELSRGELGLGDAGDAALAYVGEELKEALISKASGGFLDKSGAAKMAMGAF
ncbi:MAG: hypothetical protein IBX55_00285 [Methyloprofundus sp.]|nr:hypothetical protein [Methyloprofundus sp.]